jgi:hypothetical protein
VCSHYYIHESEDSMLRTKKSTSTTNSEPVQSNPDHKKILPYDQFHYYPPNRIQYESPYLCYIPGQFLIPQCPFLVKFVLALLH